MPLNTDVSLNVYFRFNKSEVLKAFGFSEIQEEYKSKNYHYVVGNIPLLKLIEKQEYILQEKLFVALTEKGIVEEPVNKSKQVVTKEFEEI